MSKMDALRAMREARYAEMTARTATSPAKKKVAAPVAPAVARKTAAKPAPQAEPAATEELCGHRNMSGRTCTREQGHTAKNHRYN